MNGLLEDIRLLTAMPAPSGRKGDAASIVRKSWERLGEAREDALVAADVSPAAGTPEMADCSDIAPGGGAAHPHGFHGRGTLGGLPPPEWVVDAAERSADSRDIPLRRARVVGAVADGAFAPHLNDGIPSIEVGVAVRYTHCPVEACSVRDLEWLLELLVARVATLHVGSRTVGRDRLTHR